MKMLVSTTARKALLSNFLGGGGDIRRDLLRRRVRWVDTAELRQ